MQRVDTPSPTISGRSPVNLPDHPASPGLTARAGSWRSWPKYPYGQGTRCPSATRSNGPDRPGSVSSQFRPRRDADFPDHHEAPKATVRPSLEHLGKSLNARTQRTATVVTMRKGAAPLTTITAPDAANPHLIMRTGATCTP